MSEATTAFPARHTIASERGTRDFRTPSSTHGLVTPASLLIGLTRLPSRPSLTSLRASIPRMGDPQTTTTGKTLVDAPIFVVAPEYTRLRCEYDGLAVVDSERPAQCDGLPWFTAPDRQVQLAVERTRTCAGM